jgi:hypothetical protein
VSAVDLLRGHSGELASSVLARDQLVGLALDQAAASIDAGAATPQVDLSEFLAARPLPEPACADLRRIAAEILADRKEELTRHARDLASKPPRPGAASRRDAALALRQDAALNRLLWCDVRITLGPFERAFMLASAAFIDESAEDLASTSWWRAVFRRPQRSASSA